jgi:hypothetical protein
MEQKRRKGSYFFAIFCTNDNNKQYLCQLPLQECPATAIDVFVI